MIVTEDDMKLLEAMLDRLGDDHDNAEADPSRGGDYYEIWLEWCALYHLMEEHARLQAIVDKLRMADGKLAVLEADEAWFYSDANGRVVSGNVMESDSDAKEFVASFEPSPDMAEYDSRPLGECYSTRKAAEAAKAKTHEEK